MIAPQEHLLLLSDAIDRTIANPVASHCWLNLMTLTRSISDKEIFKKTVDLVQSRIPDQGLPGFFRAMYLDIATGEVKHIAEAGRILMSMQPADTDRMTAFYQFYWQRALAYSKDRDSFVWALRNGCLPEITHLIGQAIAKNKLAFPKLRNISHIRKVAVVAPYLISPLHPPTLMATDQATILMQNGIDVNLFSCQEAIVPESVHLLGNGSSTLPETTNLDVWLASVDQNVKVYLSDHRFSLIRRGIDMLKSITEFDPDLIMFVGLHSCLARTLYEARPVLGLGVNSAPPMMPTDVWLTAQQELANQPTMLWGSEFPESLAWYHPYRIRRKPHSAPFLRTDLNILADSVVLISVGNTLHIKIADTWATRMFDILRNNPRVVWLLVGGKAATPEALKDAPQSQLRLIPQSSEISAILACCDIYINPPNMGGGFSVAEAMAEGIPVLTFAGSDGGDKVGVEAVHTNDAFFTKLDALIKDNDLRNELGNRMRERFDHSLDLANSNSGPNLMAACNMARERYQQRINQESF